VTRMTVADHPSVAREPRAGRTRAPRAEKRPRSRRKAATSLPAGEIVPVSPGALRVA
jgi:hypothetical protein